MQIIDATQFNIHDNPEAVSRFHQPRYASSKEFPPWYPANTKRPPEIGAIIR